MRAHFQASSESRLRGVHSRVKTGCGLGPMFSENELTRCDKFLEDVALKFKYSCIKSNLIWLCFSSLSRLAYYDEKPRLVTIDFD